MPKEQGYNSPWHPSLITESKTLKGSFYRHFKDKEDFALIMIDAYIAEIRGRLWPVSGIFRANPAAMPGEIRLVIESKKGPVAEYLSPAAGNFIFMCRNFSASPLFSHRRLPTSRSIGMLNTLM